MLSGFVTNLIALSAGFTALEALLPGGRASLAARRYFALIMTCALTEPLLALLEA
ncbi:MAG: hypothetical protein II124_07160 [Clostridia bacterium]|nr:hypothetical protein [Clostridia bacterium]MBQ2517930.1 hypothetical protein [Clostridia bacterium]MBQ4342244.1 hypothetical protein [Clostridia bacterium]MBR6428968.1 hypothetical protein [Clostridia bacterium]